jgi:hypothetical protein
MAKWLKVIGASWHPIQRDWTTEGAHLLRTATFAHRCSWQPGDAFVYHAIGADESRVVAIGTVRSACRHDPGVDPFDFPFACEVAITAKRNLVADGVPLEELNVPGSRDLRRSISQKSHIRLTDEEFERVVQAFRA